MDHMSLGYVLIDPTGKVLGMNERARELYPALKPLAPEPWMIDLEALEMALDGHGREALVGGVRVIVDQLANGLPRTTHLLLALKKEVPHTERRRRMLLERFRLTRAEMRLAEKVMEGLTPAQAAERLGVSIYTVRTYLKRLYAKAGVHSHATLVSKLLKMEREHE